jgi:hypothetical protein
MNHSSALTSSASEPKYETFGATVLPPSSADFALDFLGSSTLRAVSWQPSDSYLAKTRNAVVSLGKRR